MDMIKYRQVYYDSTKSYFNIIKIDEESHTIFMAVSHKNKSLTKAQILHTDKCTDWTFVPMYNEYVTAKDEFIQAMNIRGEYRRKHRNLRNFKKNNLHNDKECVAKLTEVYNLYCNDTYTPKNTEDSNFVKNLNNLYQRTIKELSKQEYIESYSYTLEKKYLKMAKQKNLFVERSDEYYHRRGKKTKVTSEKMRKQIQSTKPLGYRIKSLLNGKILAGLNYSLSTDEARDFIINCPETRDNEEDTNFRITLDNADKKKLTKAKAIIKNAGLRLENRHNQLFRINAKSGTVYESKNAHSLYRFCIDNLSKVSNVGDVTFTDNTQVNIWLIQCNDKSNSSKRISAMTMNNIQPLPEAYISVIQNELQRIALNDKVPMIRQRAYNTLKEADLITAVFTKMFQAKEAERIEADKNKTDLTKDLKVNTVYYAKLDKRLPYTYFKVKIIDIANRCLILVKCYSKRNKSEMIIDLEQTQILDRKGMLKEQELERQRRFKELQRKAG